MRIWVAIYAAHGEEGLKAGAKGVTIEPEVRIEAVTHWWIKQKRESMDFRFFGRYLKAGAQPVMQEN
ncbi:TPA: hypothetical protein I8Y12_000060 [Raoultella planticola]|nr:hypothetical protein [Raoultella planticola]